MTANGHIPGIIRAAYVHSGFMNVYRSGFYHREGKAGAFDRHAGDLYPDEATARRDIDDDARANVERLAGSLEAISEELFGSIIMPKAYVAAYVLEARISGLSNLLAHVTALREPELAIA